MAVKEMLQMGNGCPLDEEHSKPEVILGHGGWISIVVLKQSVATLEA